MTPIKLSHRVVVTLLFIKALYAGPSSTSLGAFVPVCGGSSGEFAYSSQGLQVLVQQREIKLTTGGGQVSVSYLPGGGLSGGGAVAFGLQPLAGQLNIFKQTSSCIGLQLFGELS